MVQFSLIGRYEESLQRVVAEVHEVKSQNERLEAEIAEKKSLVEGTPNDVVIDTVTVLPHPLLVAFTRDIL